MRAFAAKPQDTSYIEHSGFILTRVSEKIKKKQKFQRREGHAIAKTVRVMIMKNMEQEWKILIIIDSCSSFRNKTAIKYYGIAPSITIFVMVAATENYSRSMKFYAEAREICFATSAYATRSNARIRKLKGRQILLCNLNILFQNILFNNLESTKKEDGAEQ